MQPRGIPTQKLVGKRRFLRRSLWNAAWMYLALDFVTTFLVRVHFRSPTDSLAQLGFLRSCVIKIAILLQTYLSNTWQFYACCFGVVAAGWMDEKDCPPFYGPWSSITSLGTFWGRFWHQNLRLVRAHLFSAHTTVPRR
jgi:hypothetical protein